MKMEFSFIPRGSMLHHPHSGGHDGAPDTPAPSCHSPHQYSIRHTLLPRNAGPNSVSSALGTLAEDDGMYGPSVSSPGDLHSVRGDIRYAYEHGLCSQLLSRFEHPHCYRFGSEDLCIAFVYRLSTPHNGISSPTLCGTTNYLPYDHCGDSST